MVLVIIHHDQASDSRKIFGNFWGRADSNVSRWHFEIRLMIISAFAPAQPLRCLFHRRLANQATERLEARVPAPIKDLIARAASLEGVTLTDFVIASLQRNAAEFIREHEVLSLSVKDSASFAVIHRLLVP
jgi:uncharacterized protein (DUF1778 family)